MGRTLCRWYAPGRTLAWGASQDRPSLEGAFLFGVSRVLRLRPWPQHRKRSKPGAQLRTTNSQRATEPGICRLEVLVSASHDVLVSAERMP